MAGGTGALRRTRIRSRVDRQLHARDNLLAYPRRERLRNRDRDAEAQKPPGVANA